MTPAAPAGSSVRVAILDSGIAPLANLYGRIDQFYDFTKGGIAAAPYDDFGHGTFVASLIASSGVDSNGLYQGIVPKARLVGFKVLDSTGQGHERRPPPSIHSRRAAEAAEFAASHRRDQISLGIRFTSPPRPIHWCRRGRASAAGMWSSPPPANGQREDTGAPGMRARPRQEMCHGVTVVPAAQTIAIRATMTAWPRSVLAGRRGTTRLPSLMWSRRDCLWYPTSRRSRVCPTNFVVVWAALIPKFG